MVTVLAGGAMISAAVPAGADSPSPRGPSIPEGYASHRTPKTVTGPDGLLVLINADSTVEEFRTAEDHSVQHRHETGVSTGTFGPWISLGGNVPGTPAGVTDADGRLEIFVTGFDGAIYDIWQLSPGGAWSDYLSLGGHVATDPAASVDVDGRAEVVVTGFDGQLYDIYQTAPNGVRGWSRWVSLGGRQLRSAPELVPNADGRLQAFVAGGGRQIYTRAQITPNSGYGAYYSLGGYTDTAPFSAVNTETHQIAIFAYHRVEDRWYWTHQTAPNSDTWAEWAELPQGNPPLGHR
ncbi:MAG: hypothetical protein JOZ47_22515 [Kutzneria sp.]|nr:hypothetical protein [Kutzneria sp.]